jgi:two-component system cell cycle sensor histidine kinase/response regulator CckA
MLTSPIIQSYSSCELHPLWLDSDADKTGAAPLPQATVMVIDDQPAVRQLTARMLRDEGYPVVEAASAEEALDMLEAGTEVRLVLADIAMPGMDGVKLAETVRQRYPDQRVMLMSAFVGLIHKMGYEGPPVAILAKPFTPAELVKKVREVLRTH